MRSSETSLTLDVEMGNVAVARRFVEAAFAGAVSASIASDLVLATSELVTNAIEHGRVPPVVVTAWVDGTRAGVSVRSRDDAGGIAATDRWQPAAPDRPNGRGLGIVHAVADDVAVVRVDGTVEIRISKRIRP